jgi:hypothetical protein
LGLSEKFTLSAGVTAAFKAGVPPLNQELNGIAADEAGHVIFVFGKTCVSAGIGIMVTTSKGTVDARDPRIIVVLRFQILFFDRGFFMSISP